MTIRNQAFLKSIHCVSGEVTDARFSSAPAPVAIAETMLGGKPKKAKVAKHSWEECQALAKILNVSLGHNQIMFTVACSFESGKHYGYRNASTAYQALLTLQADRLTAKSDEAIAIEAPIAHAMIEDTATPAIIEDEWTKSWNEKFAHFTEQDWAEHHGSQVSISDRADVQSERTISFPTHTYDLMRY
jgi:hypothetical protein